MTTACAACLIGVVDPVTGLCGQCGAAAPLPKPPRPHRQLGGALSTVTGVGGLGFHGVASRRSTALPQGLSPFEAYLLSLMDGTTNVDDIVSASGLSVLDAALALQRLKALDLIAFDPPQPGAQRIRVGLTTRKNETPQPVELDASRPLAQAQAAYEAGDFDLARRCARTAVALAPELPEALQLLEDAAGTATAPARAIRLGALADTSERAGNFNDALTYYQRALVEHDGVASLHFSLAALLLRTSGASPTVVKHLERAHALEPGNGVYAAMHARVGAFVARSVGGG